jgi:hypothetical protein
MAKKRYSGVRCVLCQARLTPKTQGWRFKTGGLCRECVPRYEWRDEQMKQWALESLGGPPPEPKKRTKDVKGQTKLW